MWLVYTYSVEYIYYMWDQGVDSISATLQIGLGGIILFIYLFTTTQTTLRSLAAALSTAPKRRQNDPQTCDIKVIK